MLCLFAVIRRFFTTLLVLPFLFISLQYRHFFKVEDKVFTVWTTLGSSYIMPYKYLRLTKPKTNYIKIADTGGVIIYIGEESMLYIFPTYNYAVQGVNIFEINLPSYKNEYFPYINEIENKRASNDKMKYYKNQGFTFMDIYIRDMDVTIGNADTASRQTKGINKLMNIVQRMIRGNIHDFFRSLGLEEVYMAR